MANIARTKTLLGIFEDHVAKLATLREKYMAARGLNSAMEMEYLNGIEIEESYVTMSRKALLEEVEA